MNQHLFLSRQDDRQVLSQINTESPCPVLAPFSWRKGGMPQHSFIARSVGRRGLLVALFLPLLFVLPGKGQSANDYFSQGTQDGSRHSEYESYFGSTSLINREMQLKALNADRQKKLVADTEKLLKLTDELNTELSTSNTGVLTPDQKHKVSDIEKLARSVRTKMSTSVRGNQDLMGTATSAEYR